MKLRHIKKILILAIAGTSAMSTVHAEEENNFGLHNSFKSQDLPDSAIKTKLEALSPQEKRKAMKWLHKFDFTEKDLDFLKIDNDGGVLFADIFVPDLSEAPPLPLQQIIAITVTDAFTLHSKPGAKNIIYLDFDGHIIQGTAWNSTEGVERFKARAFDTDGNASVFGAVELNQIAEIWHRVAEDYAPFDVDVTTQQPTIFGPTVGRVLITNNVDATGKKMPTFGAGGVAYVGVWGSSVYNNYSPALVYYNALGGGNPVYVAEAASHEMGHNLGLSHDGFDDGKTTLGYYSGQGSGLISWAPIMGISYHANVTQWSSGEYTFANQKQDDIGIVTEKLMLRTDDHGNTLLTATPLLVSTSGKITVTTPETDPHNTDTSNKGIIESRSDIDVFTFDVDTGPINLNVMPAWNAFYRPTNRGANLDIQVTLYDKNGVQVAQNDPLNETDAVINTSIPAGRYSIEVSGVGNAITPYSDYASLGQYFISGTVTPVDTTPPSPNPITWLAVPMANTTTSIAMQSSVATDASGTVEYNFVCVETSNNCIDSGWQASNSYTATDLHTGTAYSYKVQARDGFGNKTDFSSIQTATTLLPVLMLPSPSTPINFNGSKNTTLKTIALKWKNVIDATGYSIFRCNEVKISKTSTMCSYAAEAYSTVNLSTFVESIPATAVRYKIKALNDSGVSGFSSEIRITP